MRRASVLLCLSLLTALCRAQQPCPLPPSVIPPPPGKNIFTDAQESDLGDVIAEGFAREWPVAEDETVAAHLREIGTQLTRYLPANNFRFEFFIIESPETNAYSLPGGRIYVSRRIIALARSDDEIAGILAHELGHIVTHQSAIALTQRFQQSLGVTQVGDRADIAEKYHRLLDTWRAKPSAGGNTEESNQSVADNVAIFAMARAGFDLQAFPDFFDRLADVYDLMDTNRRREFKFSTAVVYEKFALDGKRLFVFTSDQTAYIISLSPAAGKKS